MKTRVRHLWEVLSTGYWFIPGIMSLASGGLAFLMLYIDRGLEGTEPRVEWLYTGGAGGASTLLSTVAGSIITVAGVAFSITVAALSQASSQFGPRLLRNFMRDMSNHVVLGTFVATFLYCLLVLRAVHGKTELEDEFVPQASVTVSVFMAAASIAMLIYFIHHVSVSLQAPAVVAAVAADLRQVVAHLPDIEEGATAAAPGAREHKLPPTFVEDSHPIPATFEGYVQAVDYQELVRLAAASDLVVSLRCRAGDYVIEGSTLLRAWPAAHCPPDFAVKVNSAFMHGHQRTPEQDVEFAIAQLVEIAVRALSPAINDPFTAVNCVDALGASLCRVARHGLPGPMRLDDTGTLRLVTPVTTFAGLTDEAFNQVRQYGGGSVAVTIRMLEVIRTCAEQMPEPQYRQALARHAEMIYAGAQEALPSAQDRADVQERWEAATRALGQSARNSPNVSAAR